jgi:hypothetical protein
MCHAAFTLHVAITYTCAPVFKFLTFLHLTCYANLQVAKSVLWDRPALFAMTASPPYLLLIFSNMAIISSSLPRSHRMGWIDSWCSLFSSLASSYVQQRTRTSSLSTAIEDYSPLKVGFIYIIPSIIYHALNIFDVISKCSMRCLILNNVELQVKDYFQYIFSNRQPSSYFL